MKVYEARTEGPEDQLVIARRDEPCQTTGVSTHTIEIDPNTRFQEIAGFGASFTDSAAFLLHSALDDSQREHAMRLLFHPVDGIGLSLVRNPMGASDYARRVYSYDDLPPGQTDPELRQFSIEHDHQHIIPLIRRAKELNPGLRVFSTPWSAPGWMKSSQSMIGGQLLPQWHAVYADYFVRFIEAYQDAGIEIAAVTPQNEPLYLPSHYPGMHMPAEQQLSFVKEHLRPALREAGLATKILGYDHNWDETGYPLHLLAHGADDFDGIAWHWYGGTPEAQSVVAHKHPGKEIHVTEASGGAWIPEFWPAFSNLVRTGIDILRHGSQSFILWNLALDLHGGPAVPGFGRSTCRGLLRINVAKRCFEQTIDYTGLAHFSKYIRPGALRIASSEPEPIRSVAALNRDGTLAVVMFNDSQDEALCDVALPDHNRWRVALGPGSVVTLSVVS